MPCIVSDIHSLSQHLETVQKTPETYRQEKCPFCGKSGVWRHGHYYRKSVGQRSTEALTQPIEILRFFCPCCKKTHSVLPECLPPKRWYTWAIQELVLISLLLEGSFRKAKRSFSVSRSTCRRWWYRLKEKFLMYSSSVHTYIFELGAACDFNFFWLSCFEKINLSRVMFLCHQQGVNIP
jgi:Domain of unknown function (DUF6431)